MVSSTLLPSSSVSPRTTTNGRSRRSISQPVGGQQQQQQLCLKPNSKTQWIITSLLVGTFMFFLTRNQSLDRERQQQYRQASILPSSVNDKVDLGSILTNNNVYGKTDSQLHILRASATDGIKKKSQDSNNDRNDDDDINDGEDDDDIKIENNTKENDDDDDDDADENDNEDDDDEVTVDNNDTDNSAQETTTTTKMNSLQKLSIHAERIVSDTNRRPIKQISLLGERNSGTRWTFEHLSNCFNHSIIVRRRLTRYKHWFQYDDPSQYSHDTLVIAQFRNPYEWLKAMEHVPHHSPAHLKSVLQNDKHTIQQYLQQKLNAGSTTGSNSNVPTLENWELFLTKSWTTERVGIDLDIMKNNDTSIVMCQENFKFNDIVSCVQEPLSKKSYKNKIQYSEHQPFYEMKNDHSGLPYNNIMDMRTDKIRNFMYDVKNYNNITDVWSVQYEDLVSYGTELLLQNIQKVTGIIPQCTPKSSQQRSTKPSRIITHQYANFINTHLNWTIEEMIGYTQRI